MTLRFNWFTVILWTMLIPLMLGLGIWQVLTIVEGKAREITRLRREVKMLEQVIDSELERTVPSSSHVEDRGGMPSYHLTLID